MAPDHHKNVSNTADLQKLQDMLTVMQQQRDSALNAVVIERVENVALRRTLAERDAQIKELQSKAGSQT